MKQRRHTDGNQRYMAAIANYYTALGDYCINPSEDNDQMLSNAEWLLDRARRTPFIHRLAKLAAQTWDRLITIGFNYTHRKQVIVTENAHNVFMGMQRGIFTDDHDLTAAVLRGPLDPPTIYNRGTNPDDILFRGNGRRDTDIAQPTDDERAFMEDLKRRREELIAELGRFADQE